MNDERFDEDPELERWLRAVSADRDPALWTRVRARIEARERVPALVRWAMRPAALAASLALFVTVTSVAVLVGMQTTVATGETYTSIADALVDERDSEVQGDVTPVAPAPAATSDSGAAR